MTTLAQHTAARNDTDLMRRFIAAAEMHGIPNPQGFVEANIGRLVSADVADGQNIADVYAYAVATYTPVPRPGEDATKVRDDLIISAVIEVSP